MSVLIGTGEPRVADTLRTIISHTLNADYDVRFAVKERGCEVRRAASLYDHGLVVLFFNTMVLEGEGTLFDRAAALVRDLQGLSNGALIVITTMRPPGFATRMEQAGVDAMIDAPFDIAAMKDTISAALDCRKLRRANEARESGKAWRRAERTLRIVLRDDEPGILDMYFMFIRNRWPNATVVACPNATAAWEELQNHPPDLLITDLRNAGMSGLELIKRLAEMKASFPIVVCSGSLPDCEANVRAAAGSDLRVSCWAKPMNMSDFLQHLETLLG